MPSPSPLPRSHFPGFGLVKGKSPTFASSLETQSSESAEQVTLGRPGLLASRTEALPRNSYLRLRAAIRKRKKLRADVCVIGPASLSAGLLLQPPFCSLRDRAGGDRLVSDRESSSQVVSGLSSCPAERD
ncbi:uncharacterized protein LOC143268407 [Peromyscus maniculatus bairdii]|uniref:uncharacterized protein LOC143268407 n=1 Tax=Peromyscus maniculatus bairdii TaxID=230844 RepID=UPI003FD20279